MQTGDTNVTWFSRSFKLLIALASSVWMSTPIAMHVMWVLMAVRFITCLFAPRDALAALTKRLTYTILIVGTVHVVYGMAREQTGLQTDPTGFVCLYFSVEQTISILRNGKSIGVGIPPVLVIWLEKAEGIVGIPHSEINSTIGSVKVEQVEDTTTVKVTMKPPGDPQGPTG